MYCANCGNEITNDVNFCPYCGQSILAETKEHTVKHQTALKSKNVLKKIKEIKNYKMILSAAVGCGVLLLVIMFSLFIVSNSFSADEEYGFKIVEKYQDMLKNPDSLILRSDVAVVTCSRDGKTNQYVFFDASGENGYGALVTSTPCFVNGQYLCDSDEIPSAEGYMSMSDAEAEKYLELQFVLAYWRLYGENMDENAEEVTSAYSVSSEKIAKRLNVDCDTY